MFHAANATIVKSPRKTAPPTVTSNGKFNCEASLLALRASGGMTKIIISNTKISEEPAAIPASSAFPVRCAKSVKNASPSPPIVTERPRIPLRISFGLTNCSKSRIFTITTIEHFAHNIQFCKINAKGLFMSLTTGSSSDMVLGKVTQLLKSFMNSLFLLHSELHHLNSNLESGYSCVCKVFLTEIEYRKKTLKS